MASDQDERFLFRPPGPYGPAGEIVPERQRVQAVGSQEVALEALQGMVDEGYSYLPVKDDGEVRGIVSTGDQRGRTIGFPTANVGVEPGTCLPADGVYAGVHRRPDGTEHTCAVNLGRRPTFKTDMESPLLESHLLDFSGDLYGETAAVQFLAFLRSEKQFGGVEELRGQLVLDVEHARNAVLARRGR